MEHEKMNSYVSKKRLADKQMLIFCESDSDG